MGQAIPNWDDVRIFLAVARAGRFLLAAERLGVDHTTVARRIGGLEESLGARLMDRSPRGVRLTAEGQKFLGLAVQAESVMLSLGESVGGTANTLSGVVQLATPEAFGAYLVTPQIWTFVSRYPDIDLVLLSEDTYFSLADREADVAVSIQRPKTGRAVTFKLCEVTMNLCASADFLDACGPISTLRELAGKPFVSALGQAQGLPALKTLESRLGGLDVVLRTSSTIARREAVASGRALALLPSYAIQDRLRLVLPDQVSARIPLWVSVHADQQRLPRIRAVLEFLRQLAAPARLGAASP